MKIDLTNLFIEQAKLDNTICVNHHVTYQNTLIQRLLALLVEIGECLNETRSFKYWSNKGPSKKEVILEEYVDALHFFLSLGLVIDINQKIYDIDENIKVDTNLQFLKLYQDVIYFSINLTSDNYIKALTTFLKLGYVLKFDKNDIIKAYNDKLLINYQRQENNY